jgi:hypothetical protein
MKAVRIILVCAAAAVCGPASAFQETTTGGRQPEARQDSAGSRPSLNMPDVPARPAGTEIRVPGLGTIGNLPKLDFGLELLYGAGEPKGAREELNKDPNDIQIRGTLKYRFPTN